MSGVLSEEQLAQLTQELTQARIEHWLVHDLFAWQWWFLLALLIIPWIIFYYTADRKKLPQLWLYGLFIHIIIIKLDAIGFEIGCWIYPYKLLPFGSFAAFIDTSPLPVIYMLEYQYFTSWQSFIKISILTATVFSFICEPILEAIGIYIPLKWHHICSFPIYIAMPCLMRLVVEKIYLAAKR
ncbi:CBO0543 family protein [Sporomusa sp.]|uniref:CBO0543 family protein n=1 Tax=Sporomusa sp. TaxID=2078658 RepID=UPI002C9F3B10|nr:CBO0543 family protein [Sporomusa sp.]HWR42355.1 CBO0543 family protein [Sporomusa sp.]